MSDLKEALNKLTEYFNLIEAKLRNDGYGVIQNMSHGILIWKDGRIFCDDKPLMENKFETRLKAIEDVQGLQNKLRDEGQKIFEQIMTSLKEKI